MLSASVRAKALSESSSSSQFERIRLAGAALIDEHDVAVGEDLAIRLADHLRHLGGALAGSAGEEEQRIGLRIGAQRRQDDDVQIDLAAGLGGAVFVDLEGAAIGIDRLVVSGAGLETIDRLGGLGLIAAREDESGKNCDERPPQHRRDCIETTVVVGARHRLQLSVEARHRTRELRFGPARVTVSSRGGGRCRGRWSGVALDASRRRRRSRGPSLRLRDAAG